MELINNTIGEYHVVGRIDRGERCTIYRAIHLPLQREVALKVLDERLVADPAAIERFLESARRAAAVNHPNIVAHFDAGKIDGLVFSAMALAEGSTLRDLLAQRGSVMAPADATTVALQVARAFEAMAAVGVHHGDLSLGCIFVESDLTTTVGSIGEVGSGPAQGEAALFQAPELVTGRTSDLRSDIWSIGAILFRILTGGLPGDDGSGTDDPSQLNPDLPEGICSVVRRCLSPDPLARYESADRLRQDLERLALGFSPMHVIGHSGVRNPRVNRGPDAGPSPLSSPQPLRRPASGLTIFLSVLAMVALALGLVALFGPAQHEPVAITELTPSIEEPAASVAVVVSPTPNREEPGPAWSIASGRDEHGRWADLDIASCRLRFRLLPPGEFWMPEGPDAQRHLVRLSRGVWLLDRELSQQEWTALMPNNPSDPAGPELPVQRVTWSEANAWCEAASSAAGVALRLPSEAEWAWAAQRAWPQQGPDQAQELLPVLAPEPAGGFRGLTGNVLEWTADGYTILHRDAATDPSYSEDQGRGRVARGGAWIMDVEDRGPGARFHQQAWTRLNFLGFRPAISDTGPGGP